MRRDSCFDSVSSTVRWTKAVRARWRSASRASRRRGALAILSDFQRLVRLDSDRHTALVESATPLVPDMREDIQAGLTRVYGPGLEATFAENPALIGGMRIKVGSDVYDDSVRARLAALEARL